jgi:hypothetical protein
MSRESFLPIIQSTAALSVVLWSGLPLMCGSATTANEKVSPFAAATAIIDKARSTNTPCLENKRLILFVIVSALHKRGFSIWRSRDPIPSVFITV